MEKLKPNVVAISLASVSGILYVICALLFAINPTLILTLFKNVFHGIDITQIAQTSISLSNTLIGLVEIVIYSLITGWLFAVIYNAVSSKIRWKRDS